MKVLVANRGEIACRILRTLREMDLPSVALYTDLDKDAPHVALAREAVGIGGPDRYLDGAAVLAAARKAGATALHPGYGFLSQSASFARACQDAGVVFIGPSPESMEALGDKRGSRKTAEAIGVPVVPGMREIDSFESAREAADRLGYPVLLKAAGGGGGRGMRLVTEGAQLLEAHEAARREARAAFGDDRLILEKYISPARHVEVQILGDGKHAIALGERECSLQRRYQKVIEEAPALRIPERTRHGLLESAVRLARAVGYRSAGTVEFLVGPDGSHSFLEVNTRLQVEHPVTEMLTGIDIVRAQIDLARGGPLPSVPGPRGHAIEARVNAEDPYRGFLPQTGRLSVLRWPHMPGVRIDSGVREGTVLGTHYDSLLAKVISWAGDREQARRRLLEALRQSVILGVATNQAFLMQVLESGFFVEGETYTTTLESLAWTEPPESRETAEAQEGAERRPGAAGRTGEDRYSPWNGDRAPRGAVPRSAPARAKGVERGSLGREIRAPMTGKVVKIASAPGAAVKANEVILVMEAMKMEYRLAAPRDGVVEAILCREGDLIDLGRTVAVLRP
ncbi:MAG TPA: biotin carboxylase N-terminal domain-containing protein [Planctomycetota bacterium]|nr:biotin carboxylase N-terminal domain-containing protein [Planctomycetota bacterium]